MWSRTRDGYRYQQITSTGFVLGAHPSRNDERPLSERCNMSGGIEFPAGSWLVLAPTETYATAVRQQDFGAWLKQREQQHD